MKITRSALLDIVYRFYPRGVNNFDRIHVPPNEPFYDDTEEHRRLVEAANRGRAEYPTWKAMIRRLGDRYGLRNESLCLPAQPPPCPRDRSRARLRRRGPRARPPPRRG